MKDYKDLDKKEKKELVLKYFNTPKGRKLLPILNRLVIEGIFLLICAVVILICIFIYKLAWWYYTALIACIIAGIVFLIVQYNIRMKEYNKALNDKNIVKNKRK